MPKQVWINRFKQVLNETGAPQAGRALWFKENWLGPERHLVRATFNLTRSSRPRPTFDWERAGDVMTLVRGWAEQVAAQISGVQLVEVHITLGVDTVRAELLFGAPGEAP